MLSSTSFLNLFGLAKLPRAIVSAAVVTAALGWAASASAVLIVNDTWRDATDDDPVAPVYSETGIDLDLDGDLESAWFQGGGGTLNPAGEGGPLEGILGDTGSSSWTTYFTPEAAPVTLANAGDQLKLTWVFTTGDVNASNTSQNLRIAVVDTPAAARLLVNGAPGSADYTGYGIFANMGETLDRSDPFELVERADASGAMLSSSGEWAALASGGGDGNVGYADNTEYTFMMTITRTALGELDVLASMMGGNIDGTGAMSVAFTDPTPNNGSYSFDTFSLRPSDAATTATRFDTSLFRVEFVPIPEPASAVLIVLSGLATGMLRRRS